MSGVISIQGNLGAGKTTILSYLPVNIIKEPVDEWTNTSGTNILERWAFTFQLNALHSRTRLWHKTLQEQPNVQHFSERSPMADRYIFGEIMKSSGKMQPAEYSIYSTLCETIMSNCPVKAIIYLKCAPQICLQRIKIRNRAGEEGIDLKYLQTVHDKHEEWIKRQTNVRVFTIDTGLYDIENQDSLGELLEAVKSFIASLK